MKFAEGSLVYLKPDVEADLLQETRGGKWTPTGNPVKVLEVRLETKTLLVIEVGSAHAVVVKMDDAIPYDVYQRLPHMVAAKEAKAAAFRAKIREDSEEATEERRYRERRDYMLEHGKPMPDGYVRTRFGEGPHYGVQYAFGKIPEGDGVIREVSFGKIPEGIESMHVTAKGFVCDNIHDLQEAPPDMREKAHAWFKRSDHIKAVIKLNKNGSSASFKDVVGVVETVQDQEVVPMTAQEGLSGFFSSPDKVVLDAVREKGPKLSEVGTTSPLEMYDITLNGIKIGEVKQFSGNPLELKEHPLDNLNDLHIPFSMIDAAKMLGVEKPHELLFDAFVTVKAKKSE